LHILYQVIIEPFIQKNCLGKTKNQTCCIHVLNILALLDVKVKWNLKTNKRTAFFHCGKSGKRKENLVSFMGR
jgi:hypothetical protein